MYTDFNNFFIIAFSGKLSRKIEVNLKCVIEVIVLLCCVRNLVIDWNNVRIVQWPLLLLLVCVSLTIIVAAGR